MSSHTQLSDGRVVLRGSEEVAEDMLQRQARFDAQVAIGICIFCGDPAEIGTRYCGGDGGCVSMLTPEEHYQEFLKRIPTKKAFQDEIEGKLKAVAASGFPSPISDDQISFLCSILPINILGKPQFWPPT